MASGIGRGNFRRKNAPLTVEWILDFSRTSVLVSVGLIVVDRAFGCWRGLAIEAPRSLTLGQFINSVLRWPKCGQ